ncbi:AMP-binding protein [Bacillus mojavensis]|uniref:AMP-binding protein n=1 Tax=Bacillus mojavensis TaxID=72360 RepID=UPI002DBCF96D|nr:AMP-binding protein [Bacillus mojavensis]MEC1679638.1 AMP-binding protein [Bacillus mojavensis]
MKTLNTLDLIVEDQKKDQTEVEIEQLLQIFKTHVASLNINLNTKLETCDLDLIEMTNISSLIQSTFKIYIEPNKLFACKTIEDIATIIKQKQSSLEGINVLEARVDAENRYEDFPLTEIQAAYLAGRRKEYELGGISTQVYIELKTKLDISKLNRALEKVIKKHAMLRATFGEDAQRILENVPQYIIKIEDFSDLDKHEFQEKLLTERERISTQTFIPEVWPLFEFKALKYNVDTHYLLISLDMLILDAASLDILASEIMKYYSDETLEVEESIFSFRDYQLAYNELRNSDVYIRDKKYWEGKLSNFPSAPNLPLKNKVSQIERPKFQRIQRLISKLEWEKLKNIAKQNDVTPTSILCTVYLLALSSWSNQSKLSINLTVSNRVTFEKAFNKNVNDLIGDFTSTIQLDSDFSQDHSFWSQAKSVQKNIKNGVEHSLYNGTEFIRDLSKLNAYGNRAVIPVVFTSALKTEMWGRWGKLGDINHAVTRTPQVYLDYQASEMDGQLLIVWDYIPELLEEKLVSEIFNQYIDMLFSICNETDIKPPGISERERRIIAEYNDTDEKINIKPLHKLFESQAKKTPNNDAVIDGNYRISYQELNERSNQVARKLQQLGLKENELVGILSERCKESIINILGVLKAGGGYVPIDPQHPEERRSYVLQHSGCKFILTPDFETQEKLHTLSTENLTSKVTTESVAYVIYTSGSTGRPKGVITTHGAAANTVLDINHKFQVNEKDKVLGLSSMCFDLSVYDIFGTFAAGATLVMVKDQRDMDNVYELIEKYQITIWNSVPAIMDMMIKNLQYPLTSTGVPENKQLEKNDYSETNIGNIKKYHWSPAFEWDEEQYAHIVPEVRSLLPKFYFYMQKGRTIDEIHSYFGNIPEQKIEAFVQEAMDNGIFVSSILSPHDVFKSQNKLFDNPYDEDIKYNPEAYESFKEKQLNRKLKLTGEKFLLNQKYKFPEFIENRSSHRKFIEQEKLPLSKISQLLSVLKQKRRDSQIHYYYPSAGGLYPIDIYLYVKEDRVENLKKGIYYYSPIDNSITLVNEACTITDENQYYANKSIFNSSAVTMYLIYNAEATMPKYESAGYFYACIDAGIITNTLGCIANMLNLGTCSIGEINFNSIKDLFQIDDNQVLIHSIEVGLIDHATTPTNEIWNVQLSEPETECVKLKECNKANGGSLRVVMLSGDWIPLSLPKEIKSYFENANVYSLGGATEAAIWSIYYPISQQEKDWKSIPYGMPLANQRFYVLDYKGDFCHLNVPGELYIGGIGVAKGYMNDPEKTENAFIMHPNLGKLYRTGDYGRILEHGYIEFLGRKDSQVKIRGYRIELGEIENCLMKQPKVKNVAVIDQVDKNGKKYLSAFIVSDLKINTDELKQQLMKELPDYMVPAYFTQVSEIPLTANGKVDKNSLSKFAVYEFEPKELVSPKTEMEKVLAEIWQDVLERSDIGIHDNFFDVGGNSLLVQNVRAKIDAIYPKLIQVTDLFTNTSISELAKFMSKKLSRTKSYIEVQALKLSEEYFIQGGKRKKHRSFSFTVDEVLTDTLRKIAKQLNTNMFDFMAAFYMYLFNQVSGESSICVQLIDGSEEAYSAKVDFEQLENFEQLFKKLQNKNSFHKYAISDVGSVVMRRSEYSIIPAFIKKSTKFSKVNILESYDYTFMIDDYGIQIEIICKYNEATLKEEKAKELVRDYISLLKGVESNWKK